MGKGHFAPLPYFKKNDKEAKVAGLQAQFGSINWDILWKIIKFVLPLILDWAQKIWAEKSKDNAEKIKVEAREFIVTETKKAIPEAKESDIRVGVELGVDLVKNMDEVKTKKQLSFPWDNEESPE